MSSNDETFNKAKGPLPQPGKNMISDGADGEADAAHTPAHATGKRTLEREEFAKPRSENKDASGAAKDTEPQQSRELKRNHH